MLNSLAVTSKYRVYLTEFCHFNATGNIRLFRRNKNSSSARLVDLVTALLGAVPHVVIEHGESLGHEVLHEELADVVALKLGAESPVQLVDDEFGVECKLAGDDGCIRLTLIARDLSHTAKTNKTYK